MKEHEGRGTQDMRFEPIVICTFVYLGFSSKLRDLNVAEPTQAAQQWQDLVQ